MNQFPMGLKLKRPDPFRYAKPYDTTSKVDFCRKPTCFHVVDKYRRSFGQEGVMPELLFEFDPNYMKNFTTTSDLNYNWFPKCCAKRRKPPQDLLLSWGNLTSFGLKEQKRYDWSHNPDPRATLYSEYKTVFKTQELPREEKNAKKLPPCNIITWECLPCNITR